MKKLVSLLLAVFAFLPFAAAQRFGGGFYGGSVIETFANNEYIRLALVFAFFYIVIFFAIARAFHGNKRMAGGLALIISAFATLTIAQRNIFYGFVGEGIGTWTLFFVFLIAFVFLIKIAHDSLGSVGTVVTLWLLWILGWIYDITPIVPFSETGDIILEVYNVATGVVGFAILVIVSVVLFFMGSKKRKDKGKITINR